MTEKVETLKTIAIHCRKCGEKLAEPGALIFTPPEDGSYTVEKWHVCIPCWESPNGPRASIMVMPR